MFGSDILEIVIGVIFVYLVISLTCTAVNEGISSVLNQRGRNLFNGIRNLLNDPSFTGLAQQVYNHGLIDGITKDKGADQIGRRPSYIASKTFGLALLDILGSQGVVRAADNDGLLATAEKADDVLLEQEANTPKAAAAKVDADNAAATLQGVADKTQQAFEDAEKAVPQNQQAIDEAKTARDAAAAAVKILTARRAATAFAADQKNAELAVTASSALESALAAGRELANSVPQSVDNIEEAIKSLPDGHTKESLLVLVDKARRDGTNAIAQIQQFREDVETWFNDSMDRVSGWYKRWTQLMILGISIILVIILNVDSLMLIERLSSDKDFRAQIFANATKAVGSSRSSNTSKPPVDGQTANTNEGGSTTTSNNAASEDAAMKSQLALLRQDITPYTSPLGWTNDGTDLRKFPWRRHEGNADVNVLDEKTLFDLILKLVGLVISIGAVSLGAPFWFDTLSKFINIRGAGLKPGDSK